MKLGIFSNVIKGGSPNEVAEKTRAYGLDAVQFVPAGVFVGFGFDQEAPDAEFSRWAAAYESAGVEVCAVGGYVNLLHHDATRRRANTDKFVSYMRDMKTLGARYISTETGSLSQTSDWDFDPANRTPEAYDALRRATDQILPTAEENDVVILYEPYVVHVCDSPEAGAAFVREYNSPHLQMLMDPTNWFNNDMLDAETVTSTLHAGFEAEKGLFHLAHAKDVAPPTAEAPGKPALPGPGQGVLNYPEYVRLLDEAGYTGPLVIEHLTESEVPEAVSFVSAQLSGLRA
jgi:sugar phosphate isomerase/epimerase